jgi:hypothetical protein
VFGCDEFRTRSVVSRNTRCKTPALHCHLEFNPFSGAGLVQSTASS